MHDIGIFAEIQYANILGLIWSIIATDIHVYFFPTPNCREHQVSFVVEFKYSVVMLLPGTVRAKPTTRKNLFSFKGDEVRKHDVCPQRTCETWRQLGRLIEETSSYYLIGYYIGRYQCLS